MQNEKRKLSKASHAFGLMRMNSRVFYAAFLGEFSLYGVVYFAPIDVVHSLAFQIYFFCTLYVTVISLCLRMVAPYFIHKKYGILAFRLAFQSHAALYAVCCGLSIRLLLLNLPLGVYSISSTSVLLWGSSVAVTTFAFDLISCVAYIAFTMAPVMYACTFEVDAFNITATYFFSLLYFLYLGYSINASETETLIQEELIRKQGADLETANSALINSNTIYEETLESIDEVFLSLDLDGNCFGNPTERALSILGCDPRGKPLSAILGLNEDDTREAVAWFKILMMDRLEFSEFSEEGPTKWQNKQGLMFRVRYFAKRDTNGAIKGVTMTLMDTTAQIKTEKSAADAKIKADFILQVSENPAAFKTFLNEIAQFFAGLKPTQKSELNHIRSQLHTFKGTASIFHMRELAGAINQLEIKVKAIENESHPDLSFFESHRQSITLRLETWIAAEKQLLSRLRIFAEPELRISESQLAIVNEIFASKSSAVSIREYQSALKAQDIESLLKAYEGYTLNVAAKLGKAVEFMFESPLEHLLTSDPNHLRAIKNMVHLFTNAVDHGFESRQTRLASGKSEQGHVRVSVAHTASALIMKVSDDGGGINPSALREALTAKGIATEHLNDRDILRSVFDLGISTRKDTGEISGQGVGLNALYAAAIDSNGSLDVESTLGQGTTFTLRLPIHKEQFFSLPKTSANTRTAA